MTFPRRFLRLPVRRAGEWQVMVARTWRARLCGLAGLGALPARVALLLPACRSVHTFGMRFALDLVWLDAAGDVVRVDRDVGRFAVRSCRAGQPGKGERKAQDDESAGFPQAVTFFLFWRADKPI